MNREEIVEKIEDYKRQIKENQAYQIKYQDIRDIINSLPIIHENRLIDDPFKDTEKTLFYEFSIFLIGINQYDFAIESLQKYYSRCLELELNSNTHIKKGSILFFIAKSLNQSYMKDQAFYYWILAFLEDIISEHFQTQRYENLLDALKSPACDLLQLVFHIPFINLEKLIIRAAGILSKQSDILNPELLKFHLSKNGFQIPRLVDYISYKPNIIYLKKMKEKIEKENNHKLWEEFAAFLFSSIDGIDPMINVRPGDGSYELT